MRLVLKNFRCYTNSTFEIPDSGLVLLSGESGRGKTTLLNAIAYVLYGNVRKPYSHGKTTCSVELERTLPNNDTVYIKRSSRPNVLKVTTSNNKGDSGTTYEDEPAQSVINTIWGMNYTEFMASSYIVQKRECSVVSMSPLEQLKFVENLAFTDNVHTIYSDKIKELIASCNTEKTKFTAKWEILNKNIKDYTFVKNENFDKYSINSVTKKLQSLQKSKGKINTKIEMLKSKLEKKRKLLSSLKENENSGDLIKKFKVQLKSLEKEIKKVNLLTDKQVNAFTEKLEKLKELVVRHANYKDYISQKKRFDSCVEEHFQELQVRFVELKASVHENFQKLKGEWEKIQLEKEEFTKLSSRVNVERELKSVATSKVKEIFKEINSTKLGKSTTNLKSCKKMLHFLKEYKLSVLPRYKCPECSSKLVVNEGELVKVKKSHIKECITSVQIDGWIKAIESQQENANIKISKVPDFDPIKFEELESDVAIYSERQKELESLEFQLENRTLPKSLEKLAKTLVEPKKPKSSLKDINSEIDEIEESLRENKTNNTLFKSLKDKIKKKKAKLEELTSQEINLDSIPKLQDQLHTLSEEFSTLNISLSELQKKYERYKNIEEYLLSEQKYIDLKGELQKCDSGIKSLESELTGLIGLKETCHQAEVLAIEQTINSINTHAKVYLDQMFDEPIIIRLENLKETGKGKNSQTKAQMNTTVEYKGSRYDTIDDLSAGERQRVNLAFLLGVNDIVGSKILMLDECLNNLDADNNTDTLIYLRELSEDKLILVISHEAVKGVFDNVISM